MGSQDSNLSRIISVVTFSTKIWMLWHSGHPPLVFNISYVFNFKRHRAYNKVYVYECFVLYWGDFCMCWISINQIKKELIGDYMGIVIFTLQGVVNYSFLVRLLEEESWKLPGVILKVWLKWNFTEYGQHFVLVRYICYYDLSNLRGEIHTPKVNDFF